MKKTQGLLVAVSVVVLLAGCATDATRPVTQPPVPRPSISLSRAAQLIALEESLARYDEALRLDPGDASLHNFRGDVLSGLARLEEALAAYDEALRLHPGHALFLGNRASTLRALGRL